MDVNEVSAVLIKTFTEIQTSSGRSMPSFGASSRPLSDLPGFDSINAVEAAGLLSAHFGRKLEPSVILDSRDGTPPTIKEISHRICDALGGGNS